MGPLAQSVEQQTFNLWVVGSIPTGPTCTNSRKISSKIMQIMVKLGSLLWRLNNYGFFESLKYLLFRTFKSSNQLSSVDLIDSFEFLVKELNFETSKDIFKEYEIVFEKVSKIYSDYALVGNRIKSNLIGLNASETKFKVLATIIAKYQFDVIIETGTQHGTTSLFMDNWLSQSHQKCKLYSIDVLKYQAPSQIEKINRIILNSPVRKNFMEQTQTLITDTENTLFFHDSDHSYENMVFEFDWAWNHLKVKVIIADDVENNSAFYEFVNFEKVHFKLCKFDHGPAVGIAIRT